MPLTPNAVKNYDVFYGRAFRIDGKETWVSLQLKYPYEKSYYQPVLTSIAHFANEYHLESRAGKKILLDESPGELENISFMPFTFEHRDLIIKIASLIKNGSADSDK